MVQLSDWLATAIFEGQIFQLSRNHSTAFTPYVFFFYYWNYFFFTFLELFLVTRSYETCLACTSVLVYINIRSIFLPSILKRVQLNLLFQLWPAQVKFGLCSTLTEQFFEVGKDTAVFKHESSFFILEIVIWLKDLCWKQTHEKHWKKACTTILSKKKFCLHLVTKNGG